MSYQIPVLGLEKIRRTRKKVKNILSDIGLEECRSLCEELQRFDPGDETFDDTEWSDFTEGFNGRRKKKWKYRTQALCCSLCRFSSRSWYSFRSHLSRYHEEDQVHFSLSACSSCPFIAHPKVIAKHYKIFHTDHPTPVPVPMSSAGGDRYKCRKCSFQDSLLYCMKKHVLLNHFISLLNRFAGQKTDSELRTQGIISQKFYCKVCGVSAETSEHLLYHILTSEKHKELDVHLQALIYEQNIKTKKFFPLIAPKAQLKHLQSSGPSVTGINDPQPLGGGPLSGTVLHGVTNSSTTLVCAPGTSQTFLPAQASALVQLASAEAKGLLRPGTAVAFQNAQPARGISATLPTVGGIVPPQSFQSNIPPKQLPIAVGITGQPQQHQQVPRQVLLPPGIQVNVPGLRGPGPQPFLLTQRLPLNQPTPRGTMLTSQNLLSHLIPTGNKVNGLPTYTLAPLQVTLPVQPGNVHLVGKAPLPVSQINSTPFSQQNKPASNPSQDPKQAKKWITCPVCNELFPSNVYQAHVEVHKDSSKKTKLGMAARAPFLRKMPDKTVKCLMCKILLSEKGLFEHLLHGLNCLYCPGMFYSIKQLVEHTNLEHNPRQKANCDFMRREYRLYTDDHGTLLFPYFDINTTAPKEVMGDKELNLALVTNSLDLIFLKMQPSNPQTVCGIPMKNNGTDCPFCSEKLLNMECYQMHLREKHYIMPTIHAILKTPAYKCIYCSGVYTGKTTPKAIVIHVQRCRCAPKTVKDAERLMNTGPNGRAVAATHRVYPGLPPPVTVPLIGQAPTMLPVLKPKETDAELQSKLRLELAVREAMEANKREREARLAKRKKLEKERMAVVPPPEVQIDPTVQFALDPIGMEMRSFEERREFVSKYFHMKPYLSKKELDALANRLLLNKTDVACQFGTKRTKCMRAIQRNTAVILLGFNMGEVMKVKHNLLIPEIEPEKTAAVTGIEEAEPAEEEAEATEAASE